MCSRITCLLVLVLLLCAAPMGYAGALVAHWSLDDAAGSTAGDSSGNGFDGAIGGTPNWVDGVVGGALDLDGATNYIDVNTEVVRGTCSLALWMMPRNLPYSSGYRSILHNNAWNSGSLHGHLRVNTSLFNFDVNGGGGVTSTTAAQSGEWYHVAGTFDTEAAESKLYVNGALEATAAGLNSALYVGPLNWGAWNTSDRYFDGAMDDIRVYNRVLKDAQVEDLFNGIPPAFTKAEEPVPVDGTTGVAQSLLQWSPGEDALFHNVYLGTSPDLTEADLIGPRLMFPMWYHVPGFASATTYYWRVDEVGRDGVTVYAGDVWSFTAAPVEAFDPKPRNGDKWIDLEVVLTWQPGQGAMSHDVYFGSDADAVASRDAGVLVGDKQPARTYTPEPLQEDTTYYWVVDEYDNFGAKHEGELWHFTTAGPGGGAKAEYFNNMDLSGVPVVTRIDPAIDFAWGNGTEQGVNSPDAAIPVEYFSARWRADLEIAVADTYTFITRTDDGSRLWLNDELIVDQWVDQGPTDAPSEPIDLEPGIYALRM